MESIMSTWGEMSERERDELVARLVMGWQPRPCDLEETGGDLTVYDSGDACCPRCGEYEHINSFEHGVMAPPHYTTNLAAAWDVLRAMAARPRSPNGYLGEAFTRFCDLLLPSQGGEIWTSYSCLAETIVAWTPERICLAALRALDAPVTLAECEAAGLDTESEKWEYSLIY